MKLLPILVLALMAGVATAQVKVDLEKHFPGIVDAFESDYSSLYEVDAFWKLEGKAIESEELDQWKRKWKEEQARVEGEIDKLLQTPGPHLDFLLRKRLKRHHYFRDRFSGDDFEANYDYAPFILYIQQAKSELKNHTAEDVERYGTLLQALERSFRLEYAEPLELQVAFRAPGYALFLLDGREEYDEYAKEHKQSLHFARAHYDPRFRIGVTYQDRNEKAEASDEIHTAMHEMVHAFQHAYNVNAEGDLSKGLNTPAWFNEGFAEFFAYRVRRKEEGHAYTVPVRSCQNLEAFVRSHGEAGAACILSLGELAMQATYGDAVATFERKLASKGNSGGGMGLLGLLYRQSDLWMHYLSDGEGKKYRRNLHGYVREVLGGNSNADALAIAFAGVPMPQLEEGFLRFLEEHNVDPEITALVRTSRVGIDAVSLPKGSGAKSVAMGRGQLDLDVSLRFASVLEIARWGRYGAALERMGALLEDPEAEFERDRLERERDRLEGMVELRRDFLEHLGDSGKKLTIKVRGEKLVASVEFVDDERVELGSNRVGISELKLEDIDPLSFADCMRSSKVGYEEPFLVAYAYVLEGKDDWKKVLLADKSSEAVALREDAVNDYPERLELAPSAGGLEGVDRLSSPETPMEAEATLDAIANLLDQFGLEKPVRKRSEALRSIAEFAAGVAYVEDEAFGMTKAEFVQDRLEAIGFF